MILWKTSCATQCFWKTFLVLILIESSLDSWILSLESWFLFLEIKFPLEPWSVLNSILNNFYNTILSNLWISLNFFFFIVPKSFPKFSGFLNLENLCYSFFSSLHPCQRIQNDTVWEFFWFFPFPFTKVFRGLTAWEFFCIPIHKVSKV